MVGEGAVTSAWHLAPLRPHAGRLEAGAIWLQTRQRRVAPVMAVLCEKNLLRRESGTDDRSRYRMLETIRECALARLKDS